MGGVPTNCRRVKTINKRVSKIYYIAATNILYGAANFLITSLTLLRILRIFLWLYEGVDKNYSHFLYYKPIRLRFSTNKMRVKLQIRSSRGTSNSSSNYLLRGLSHIHSAYLILHHKMLQHRKNKKHAKRAMICGLLSPTICYVIDDMYSRK